MTADASGAPPLFCDAHGTATLAHLHQDKVRRTTRRSGQSGKKMGVRAVWEAGRAPGRGEGGEV